MAELKELTQEQKDAAAAAQASLEAKTEVTLIEKVTTVGEIVASTIKVEAPKSVEFTPLDGSESKDDIATYNKTASSLAESINTNLVGFGKNVQKSVNDLNDYTGSMLGSVRTDTNKGLADLFGEIKKLKSAHDATQTKIAGLDAVFASDVDISDKVGQTLKILNELSGVNVDFFDNFKAIVERINQTQITTNKRFKITSKDGSGNFNLRLNDIGEFASADEYIAKIESVSARGVEGYISKADKDGFDIKLVSKRYLIDKAHDAEAEAVEVVVSVSHALRTPFLIGDEAGSNKIVTNNDIGA